MVNVSSRIHRIHTDAHVGESSPQKGTSFSTYPSLEGDSPGSWDETVLNNLDDVMFNANKHGIKLLISIYSYNALSAQSDFYGKWYGTGNFYTDKEAIQNFEKRIAYVLSHVNPHNNKTWAESSEYIFAFEAQNEAMHDQVRSIHQSMPQVAMLSVNHDIV